MFLGVTDAGLATLIAASAGAVVSVLSAIKEFRTGQAISRVHTKTDALAVAVDVVRDEVRTNNGLTLGQLGNAGETRRIDGIEPLDRTDAERAHSTGVHAPRLPTAKELAVSKAEHERIYGKD